MRVRGPSNVGRAVVLSPPYAKAAPFVNGLSFDLVHGHFEFCIQSVSQSVSHAVLVLIVYFLHRGILNSGSSCRVNYY